MSFNEIFKNPVGILVVTCVSFLTFLSYKFDEKYFFLVPLILIPLYSVQYSFFLPMLRIILVPGPAKFDCVDISGLKKLFSNAILVEVVATVTLLTWAFLHRGLVLATTVYTFYAISWMFYLAMRFKNTFNEEAKQQKIDKRINGYNDLFTAIREQVN